MSRNYGVSIFLGGPLSFVGCGTAPLALPNYANDFSIPLVICETHRRTSGGTTILHDPATLPKFFEFIIC